MTVLTSSQYTLLLNPASSNQLWGIGGTVTYLQNGAPIPAGQSLIIQRILPLTQDTSVRNQGNYYPTVTEQALDKLCMEIQQIAARTGQMRGTWATNILYNFGDSVVDGANGNSTGNYYICVNANTSGVWATDLANGDWSLVLNIQNINAVIGAYLPLIGGTISGNLNVSGTTALNVATGVTQSSSDSSANLATTAQVQSAISANATHYCTGTFQYNVSTATGKQTVTGITTSGGASFTPKQIDFDAAFISGGNASCMSWGFDDLTRPVCWVSASSVFTPGLNASASINLVVSGGNAATGLISSASNGSFTISWTKQGAPTGNAGIIFSAKG